MTSIYIYCDKMTDNYIEICIIDDYAIMQKHFIDSDNGKLFVSLLKEAFSDIKTKGAVVYRQYVMKNEYTDIIKNVVGWKLVKDDIDDDIVTLECSIDDAPICIVQGLLYGQ